MIFYTTSPTHILKLRPQHNFSLLAMSRANTLRPGGSPAHGNIEEAISTQLTERECTILDKGITAYRKRGDITMLVQSMSTVLNTNKKRQLLVPIRNAYVKPTDRIKFNNLAVKYGIAVTRDGTRRERRLWNASERFLERGK